MKVLYGEGLATHAGPESCVAVGNRWCEALTGVRAGRVLSREKGILPKVVGRLECRRSGIKRKAMLRVPQSRGARGLHAVVDPEHVRRHLVRKPGGPMVVWGSEPGRAGNPKGARR